MGSLVVFCICFGLIVNVSKTEYLTANCNQHPTLQIYSQPLAHLTDFKYLGGSMMALSSADFKRGRALAGKVIVTSAHPLGGM